MAKLGELISQIDGRLTLTSGVPVTTSDVTAATTIYFTPYKGNHIALYNEDFEDWRLHNFTELSYSLAGIAADTNFDVFVYNNAGTLSLEIVAWSGATTRATALAVQDGVYVKSGEPAKRYLGTFRTTSTIGQCEDSKTKRYCWNYYNQKERRLLKLVDDGSWTYNSGTWRYADNDTTNKVEIVVGLLEDASFYLEYQISGKENVTGTYFMVGIGKDSSSSNVSNTGGQLGGIQTNNWNIARASLTDTPFGYHYYSAIERVGSNEVYFLSSTSVQGSINGFVNG